MKRTICILVLYHPNYGLLGKAVQSIIDQCDRLWISDNTDNASYENYSKIFFGHSQKIIYHKMEGNVGIAKAQNEGIKYAIDHLYDYIYFLDQDTISPQGIVEGLIGVLCGLEKDGIKVGGVAGQPYNRYSGKDYVGSIKKGNPIKEGVLEVVELMNSSSLIKTSMFLDVGMMEEYLFIDGVDYEVCWRARYYANYHFFMDTTLKVSHMLGEGDKIICGKNIKNSTAFRTYYQFRNLIFFIVRNYVPLYYKIYVGTKYIVRYFYYPIFCKPRWAYFINIHRGIRDGLRYCMRYSNLYHNLDKRKCEQTSRN